MTRTKIDIKKELTVDEFKSVIVTCETLLDEIDDISTVTLGCETKSKEIIPAKEVYLMLHVPNSYDFEVLSLNKTVHIDPKYDSIIAQCAKTKQPLLVNSVTESFLYSSMYDNISDCNLKDLLLIPIIDDDEERTVLAIIWAGILVGSWNQYTPKDLEYMSSFSNFIKKFFQKKHLFELEIQEDTAPPKSSVVTKEVTKDEYFDCGDAYHKLQASVKREQEYFSAIIHDVRTPMNSVMGFLELLKLREDDRDKREYIETALKSAESMVSLINDALDISKMASGKMSIEKIEFNPLEELSDVAKLFYNTARKNGITLIVSYDATVPKTIFSDYHRIKQILNNLLSNAIKFTPKDGTITLEIIYDRNRDGLTLSVKDSGIGIAEDMQKNIFTPYTQEKSSTSREYGGTGLGLSIAQQLSVLLGGKLELESVEGEGSRFFFNIPCGTAKDTPLALEKDKLDNLKVMLYGAKIGDHSMQVTKKYLETFSPIFVETKNNKPLISVLDSDFDILVVSRNDTMIYQDELLEILEENHSVIIVGDGYLNEGYSWFIGNVRRINAPILPQELFKTMVELVSLEEREVEAKERKSDVDKIKGRHALIVDDNTIILKFMREVLKTLELEITLAQSGEEAIQRFQNEKFDIIFIDENMLGMDGSEAIAMMREKERRENLSKTAMVSLTGDAHKEMKEKLLNAGADAVLTKPVHIQEIQDAILNYI